MSWSSSPVSRKRAAGAGVSCFATFLAKMLLRQLEKLRCRSKPPLCLAKRHGGSAGVDAYLTQKGGWRKGRAHSNRAVRTTRKEAAVCPQTRSHIRCVWRHHLCSSSEAKYTMLQMAILLNKKKIVEYMIPQKDLDLTTRATDGTTALMTAVEKEVRCGSADSFALQFDRSVNTCREVGSS